MILKCLIVDDEPIARKVIKSHIKKIDSLEIIAEFSSAVQANNFLINNNIDLLFLDIQMPELNGFEFLRQKRFDFQILLTTAYSEYAVESYRFVITDYLLKPISFQRFNEAIQKAIEIHEEKIKKSLTKQAIYLKADKRIHKVNLSDILLIQGYGNYLKFMIKGKKTILVLEKIESMLHKLEGYNFMRVHKSYIINLDKITSLEGNSVHIETFQIPISKTYKKSLMKLLN